MGWFDGKKGVILGVANDHSIAWAVAQLVLSQGAVCGFTHLPDRPDDKRQRNRHRVEQLLSQYPQQAKFLLPLDVTRDEDLTALAEKTQQEFGQVDFLVHSIAYAPLEDLKSATIDTSRDGFKLAMEISAYSLIAACRAFKPLFAPRASVVTMTYFGGEKAVPGYNVMGVCKAALDSIVKYLAFDLGAQGTRVNAVSAGPLRTLAGRAAGVDDMLVLYEQMAPLGRNVTHQEVGQSAGFLLSDLSDGITGEILHVDAGYNIMGSPGRMLDRIAAHLQQAPEA